jgi:hypothetical protein
MGGKSMIVADYARRDTATAGRLFSRLIFRR